MLKLWDPRALPLRVVVRYAVIAFAVAFVVVNYILWQDSQGWDTANLRGPLTFGDKHPITKLMLDARAHQETMLTKRSKDIKSAAARYRQRRGRHPPPGFEHWVEAALKTDSIIIEDYFDRIYKDLTPFWALDRDTLVKRAAGGEFHVEVRNGAMRRLGKDEGRVPWLKNWGELIGEFSEHLPDLDMPINYMDEPRIFVPQEEMSKLVETEQHTRHMPAVNETKTSYKGLADVDASNPPPYQPEWFGNDHSYWDLSAATCPPGSPSHGVESIKDFRGPAEYPQNWAPPFSFKGFVQNFSASIDPCTQPHLRGLHGSFVEPLTLSSTTTLFPLFGGSKLASNSEILLPGAMYLDQKDERYSGGDSHGPPWQKKKNGLIWRGVGSGGRASEDRWQHFQRHHLVDMLNATTVSRMEATGNRSLAFELPSTEMYQSTRISEGKLGPWLKGFADAAFISLCPPGECPHFEGFFDSGDKFMVAMKEQYKYKFLPDIDGNSFSARFLAFLRSTSVPLKATAYVEWHDDRLVPWVHFVPLDNTFQDLYPALEYFSTGRQGDAAARYIAETGKAWAETSLRREDMRIYVWRLLLEWGRICDENRDTLGYVADLQI